MAWTTRPAILATFIMSHTASNTLLLRRQLQELMKHPVEGFSAGKINLTFLSWLRRDIVSGLVNEDNLYEWEILIIGWVYKSSFCFSRLWSRCCMQTTRYRLVRFGDLILQSMSFTIFCNQRGRILPGYSHIPARVSSATTQVAIQNANVASEQWACWLIVIWFTYNCVDSLRRWHSVYINSGKLAFHFISLTIIYHIATHAACSRRWPVWLRGCRWTLDACSYRGIHCEI